MMRNLLLLQLSLIALQSEVLAAEPSALQRGRTAIERHGCAVCHAIPGIASPGGRIGPPLKDVARSTYIAGTLPNSRANLEHWIRDPQHLKPGTVMPDTGVSEQEAKDIAAYLYAH